MAKILVIFILKSLVVQQKVRNKAKKTKTPESYTNILFQYHRGKNATKQWLWLADPFLWFAFVFFNVFFILGFCFHFKTKQIQ